MKSATIRSTKPTPQQQPTGPPAQKPHPLPLSPCEDLYALIAKQAYEFHSERGYRHGSSLDDWLEAEREILSQIPPV